MTNIGDSVNTLALWVVNRPQVSTVTLGSEVKILSVKTSYGVWIRHCSAIAGSRWTLLQQMEDAAGGRCMCTQQTATLFCVQWHHGRHLESVRSNRKSDHVNRRIFTWRTILPKFIPIPDPIWNDGALGFFEDVAPKGRTTRRWVRYGISSWSKTES